MKKANGFLAAAAAAALAFASGAALAVAGTPDSVKIDDLKVKESLTGKDGDAADGKKRFADPRSTGDLQAIQINSKAVFGPETVMPGFCRSKTVARDTKNSKARQS